MNNLSDKLHVRQKILVHFALLCVTVCTVNWNFTFVNAKCNILPKQKLREAPFTLNSQIVKQAIY